MLSLDKYSDFQSLSDLEAQALSGGASATAAGIISQGINRISVDLRDFVDPEFRNQDGLNNSCTADLNAGTLNITCDVKQYVVGGGLVPFSG